jgi:hypothetical protein
MAADGELQLAAGVCLMEASNLVRWDTEAAIFRAVAAHTFEDGWHEIDAKFGRFACWNWFSTGAESFIKGMCLTFAIDIRKTKDVPAYPSNVSKWLEQFRQSPAALPRMTVTTYGTLNDIQIRFSEFFAKTNAPEEERVLVRASFELLRASIRNRDAHAYVPNVRGSHFHLVEQLYCPAFNALASWLPCGAESLTSIVMNSKS